MHGGAVSRQSLWRSPKYRNYTGEKAVHRVAAVWMLSAVNSGFPSDIDGLARLHKG